MCVILPKIEGYIRTYSGVKFWPLDPKPSDIKAIDIAHALSQKVRWQGHCRKFYSVALHCLRVAEVARLYAQLEGFDETGQETVRNYGILHDDNEAYLPDIPSPLKPLLRGWRRIENRVDGVIFDRFGLGPMTPDIKRTVKKADRALLKMESQELFPKSNDKSWPGTKSLVLTKDVISVAHIDNYPKKVEDVKATLLYELNRILK